MILIILISSVYLVYHNRSDSKLINSFFSFLILGALGLFISSLSNLKSEKQERSYFGNMIVKMNPLEILAHDQINNPNDYSIAFDEYKEISWYKNKDMVYPKDCDNELRKELDATIFFSYLTFILGNKFSDTWLRKSDNYYQEGEVALSSNLVILDKNSYHLDKYSTEIQEINIDVKNKAKTEFPLIWNAEEIKHRSEIRKILPGWKDSRTIKLPPKTKLSVLQLDDECCYHNEIHIKIENEFILYNIVVKWLEGNVSGMDKLSLNQIEKLKLNNIEIENIKVLPLKLFTIIETKKWRSGHPNMKKYFDWITEVDNSIYKALSNEKFQGNK